MTGDCVWCGEPLLVAEQLWAFDDAPMHQECAFRSVGGSVAHVLRRCHCFDPTSHLGDPPGMSKRAAARAAIMLHRQINGWFPEQPPC